MMPAFVTRFLLRLKNIKAGGRVFFKKHPTAEISVEGYFVVGAPTLGDASQRQAESHLILEKFARMEVNNVTIGRGTRLKVQTGGRVKIGHNTYLSDNCFVAISTQLKIGSHCAISYDVQFLDDDGHRIDNREVKKPITVGDRVWIGSRAVILKGTDIGSGSVVAAGSVVSGKFPENVLIGGVPARILRENINWK